MTGSSRGLVVAGVVAGIGAVVVVGLSLVGSPADARLYRLDERRVNDLQQIARAVDLHWTRTDVLPASLDELDVLPGAMSMPRDPESGALYVYRVTGPTTYELCAEFGRTSIGPSGRADQFWSHAEGRHCVEVTAKDIERRPDRVRQP